MYHPVVINGVPVEFFSAVWLFVRAAIGFIFVLGFCCWFHKPWKFITAYAVLFAVCAGFLLTFAGKLPAVVLDAWSFAIYRHNLSNRVGQLFDNYPWRGVFTFAWVGYLALTAYVTSLACGNLFNTKNRLLAISFKHTQKVWAVASVPMVLFLFFTYIRMSSTIQPYTDKWNEYVVKQAEQTSGSKPYCFVGAHGSPIKDLSALTPSKLVYETFAYKMGWPNGVSENGGSGPPYRGLHFGLVTRDGGYAWSFYQMSFVKNTKYTSFGKQGVTTTLRMCSRLLTS